MPEPKDSPLKPKRKRTPAQQASWDKHFKPHTWKPGQSGNPKGRPRTQTLSEAYRAWLRQPYDYIPEGVGGQLLKRLQRLKQDGATNAEAVALLMGVEAQWGKNIVQAAAEIADRVEGKPRQTLELGGDQPLVKAYIGFSPDEWDKEKEKK